MWYPQKVVEMDCIIIFLVLFPCYTLAQIHVTVFVCERDSHVLHCDEGSITIFNAVYGRTQSNVCVTSSTTNCERDVTDELVNYCNGQVQCTVEASNSIAGDPCGNVFKYLEITYTCEVPDWSCNFSTGLCGLNVTQGYWEISTYESFHYIYPRDFGYTSSFILPHGFTTSQGTLLVFYYRTYGSPLRVRVCSSQPVVPYGITAPNIKQMDIQYSCDGINDVKIEFTATRYFPIGIYNIELYEESIPSTVSSSTSTQTPLSTQSVKSTHLSTSTQSAATTQSTTSMHMTIFKRLPTSAVPSSSSNEQPSDSTASTIATTSTNSQLSSRDALSSAVIPAVSSIVVLLVIGLIIAALFVYLRRRSREPKPVGPVDQDDDDPSLYNNPVYVSKEDDFSTPDLLVGINFRNGNGVSPAPNGSPEVDNQYEDFDGDQKNTVKGCPLPIDNSSSPVGPLHSSSEAPDVDLVNTNMYHILERPESEVIYEEGDHTYEQAQGPAQSSRNHDEKANEHKGTDDVYENSSFASPVGGLPQGHVNDGGENGSSDVIAVLDDDEEYNALTFNQSSDITRALKKPKMAADHVNDGYGALDLPQDKAASLSTNSAELHNDDVYNSLDEPLVGQQNEKPSTTGERSNGKGDVDFQQGAESDYHNYQDPTQMDQEGSGSRSPDLDVFSNDQYNILDSGKQVGDYHVYQSTDDRDGGYTELDTSKMSGEDEYSTIDLDQTHKPNATGIDNFEPIYSEEVYSEFN